MIVPPATISQIISQNKRESIATVVGIIMTIALGVLIVGILTKNVCDDLSNKLHSKDIELKIRLPELKEYSNILIGVGLFVTGGCICGLLSIFFFLPKGRHIDLFDWKTKALIISGYFFAFLSVTCLFLSFKGLNETENMIKIMRLKEIMSAKDNLHSLFIPSMASMILGGSLGAWGIARGARQARQPIPLPPPPQQQVPQRPVSYANIRPESGG